MTSFHLQIVTPDGLMYDGQAQRVLVRSIAGDVCILPRHADYVTALGMGRAKVVLEDGQARTAACIGGMLSVKDGRVRLVATTFEWAEEIDLLRAQKAEERARAILERGAKDEHELTMAQAHLQRALVRSSVARQR